MHFSVTRLAAVCEALLLAVWAVREGFVFVLLEAVCLVCVVVFFLSFLAVVFSYVLWLSPDGFLYSRMPRLLRGVCHWRESE
jgi:hypothetical protein